MATPKRIENLPQKGKLVNPYQPREFIEKEKEEPPSNFIVKID